MAQHDYVIANGTGAAVRSDLNNGLAAIVSQNSGTTEPTTTYAYMRWADTTAGVMKMRNGANNAWITLYQLDGEWSTIAFENGSAAAPSIYFKDSGTDTGIYSPGTDQVAISTGGTVRLSLSTTAVSSALAIDHPLGAVGTPSITFTGDLNTGIYSPAADTLAFVEGGVEAMRIDSSGRVGIGTTSPNFPLDLVGSFGLRNTEAGGPYSTLTIIPATTIGGSANRIQTANTTSLAFETAGSERVRIDTSGRLLVGTSSARSVGLDGGFASGGASLTVETSDGSFSLIRNRNDYIGPYFRFGKSRGSIGSNTVVSSGDSLGEIQFCGADGSDLNSVAASISVEVDGTPGANDMPGRLVFSTTADGASSPTERMRIAQNGNVLVNTTTEGAGAGFSTKVAILGNDSLIVRTTGVSATGAMPGRFWHDAASGDNLFINFATDATYTSRASIDYNRSAGQVRYNVTSDRRLKSGIENSESALNVLNQIKVRSYIWTETGYSIPYGFIAQELNEAVPDAVKVGDDGDDVVDTWAVDNAKLVPLLTKALQEALQKIDAMEARLAALETS